MKNGLLENLTERFGEEILHHEIPCDGIITVWVSIDSLRDVLRYAKEEHSPAFEMLYDLTAVDERIRRNRNGAPYRDFTVVYHLYSFKGKQDLRIKVALHGKNPSVPTVIPVFPNADWYEREIWDMFGIEVGGHPNLCRILMPSTWNGHPLRKDHPARGTELSKYQKIGNRFEEEEKALQFRPEDWGLKRQGESSDFLFLNLGPQHPGTHGVLRVVLQLDGEEIIDAIPDIGFHHRGAEKMGERQTWHTYIPYTDRVDYLSGVLNNLPYVMAVEQLAGIDVPERAQVIRVMLCELFRIASHLVWYGTFAQDVGALSPVFYMFSDRERIFDIIEAICGGRMHPNWFRIGGVANDLPQGWEGLVKEFIKGMPQRLDEYDKLVMQNTIFKGRTVGIGAYDTKEALEWGVTGPGLRATGYEYDFRKEIPYCGYENYDFEIPTAENGDCYDRGVVRVEEMRQSLRIVEQCMENMPEGQVKSDHPLATPPRKDRTLQDIETLIHHFLNVTWGPVIPAGEASVRVEGAKGANSYYLISDEDIHSYRTRIRTPSFPHIQMVPFLCKGWTVADLMAILGSIDFVLADIDR